MRNEPMGITLVTDHPSAKDLLGFLYRSAGGHRTSEGSMIQTLSGFRRKIRCDRQDIMRLAMTIGDRSDPRCGHFYRSTSRNDMAAMRLGYSKELR
jgi:hypothetical protein